MTKVINDVYRVHDTVNIMGRSWRNCVDDRPLGINNLIRIGKTVQIDPRFITCQMSNGKGERTMTPEDFRKDALPWQPFDNDTWHLNRSMFPPHWEF